MHMGISKNARIYVAGHRGLAGSAICRALTQAGFTQLICRTRAELNLMDTAAVRAFYETERPEYAFIAAARVGGIKANNDHPASFLYENLQIQNNLIHLAKEFGVRKLLFLGSSCMYPKHAPQPMKEEHLLTGPLEPTNEGYALAKITGIKMCQAYRRQYGCDFIAMAPPSLYGVNDHYDPQSNHVVPALLRRFHEAKAAGAPKVICWGSGAARREFMHSDDVGRACLFLMENYSREEFINAGSGMELSIRELAGQVAHIVGYTGLIEWDTTKPDGTPRKLMDNSRLFAMGWRPQVSLEAGLRSTYEDFQQRLAAGKIR
jgi:GDP-L-fucose synthase